MSFVLLEDTTPRVDPKLIEKYMSNKSNPTDPTIMAAGEEFKDQNLKYNLSKFEYDLYHEEDDVVEKVIRIKRVSMPNKGEKWKIFEDSKLIFTVEGAKLTNKEKEFLRTVDGVNFLISQYKQGLKSINFIKTEMKKRIK